MTQYICEVSPHSVTVYDDDDGHADQIIGVFVCNEDIRWAERKEILKEIGRLIEGKSDGTAD
jgi:hypothetical protein